MKKHLSGRSLAIVILLVLFAVQIGAQEKLDLQMVQRIRKEGLENSKITDLLIYLCDVYGPRLPASPQYIKAGEWVVGKAKELGLENAQMESYGTFGRSWELQKFYAAMTAPQYMPLIAFPKAWTPGTNGVLKGNAVLINVPVAKSHSATGVSLGLKGLMGLIWDRDSFHSKFNINQGIADLATVIKPQLTILDATRAMASGGPGGPGDVKKPNLIIAGVDPVAVDTYGVGVVQWYGWSFKGRQVEHLLIAHQRGLGKIDVDKLNIFKGTV